MITSRAKFALLAFFYMALVGACDQGGSVRSVPTVRGGIQMDLLHEHEELVVSITNQSGRIISLADESLIGFGQGGARIELKISKGGERILPCAHMDPLRQERPRIIIEPGRTAVKSVKVDLVRKIYCLKAGDYEAVAVYPLKPNVEVASGVVSFGVSG